MCVLSEDASSLSRENYYGTASAKATADALNAQVGHGGADHSQPYLNLEYSCMEMHEGNKQCETRRVKDHCGFVCRCELCTLRTYGTVALCAWLCDVRALCRSLASSAQHGVSKNKKPLMSKQWLMRPTLTDK